MAQHIFGLQARAYRNAGYYPVEVEKGNKNAVRKEWNKFVPMLPPADYVEDAVRKYSDCNIGLATGIYLSTRNLFAAADIDVPPFVPFMKKVIGGYISGKIGSKGLTILCQAEPGLESVKLKAEGKPKHGVELMIDTGMVVIPDSLHPKGFYYTWDGKTPLEITHDQYPLLTKEKYKVIELVMENKHAWEIAEGGPAVQGHEPMLALTACGVANVTDDLEWLADCLNALFHPDYTGNTKEETLNMLRSAKKKGLGAVAKANKAGFVREIIESVELFHDTAGRPYCTSLAIAWEGGKCSPSLERLCGLLLACDGDGGKPDRSVEEQLIVVPNPYAPADVTL